LIFHNKCGGSDDFFIIHKRCDTVKIFHVKAQYPIFTIICWAVFAINEKVMTVTRTVDVRPSGDNETSVWLPVAENVDFTRQRVARNEVNNQRE